MQFIVMALPELFRTEGNSTAAYVLMRSGRDPSKSLTDLPLYMKAW